MRLLTAGLLAMVCAGIAGENLLASDNVIVGSVRIELLSSSLVRLEAQGAEGFEDRPTFHVVNRDWPGTDYSSNLVSGEVVLNTAHYAVHVPQGATSLAGTYVTSSSGKILYQFDGTLNNSVWVPGPSSNPQVMSFADTPRLIPPAWGITPAPSGASLASTSGWDTNNDAPDVYVFVPDGSYQQLRSDFLKLTGPSEMVPLYALGMWDSRYYNYSETTALQEIDDNRSRGFPLDVLVIDTGWRQNASTGYQPNPDYFPDLPRFFSDAHAKNVRVVFNDHPEPVGISALDPAEVTYRYTNLAQINAEGLDIWWYDRNWGVSLLSPASNLRKEVWGMKIYQDEAIRTNAPLRPMIMANVDGIDNGIRNNPMDVAAHRYSIQWTGDIAVSPIYLKYAVENAVHSGVQSLFPYESDDLGGHTGGNQTPEGYIRWIEYGALSPVYRPHCTLGYTRMPWTFGAEAEWTTRRFIKMRYRLLPMFYAAAHKNYVTGEPILRRLDLDYPQYPEASQENQYLLGHSLLVAPVTGDNLATVPSSWLTTTNGQSGLSAAYFSNTNLSGASALTRVDSNIDFNWDSGSPGDSVPAENFTARWTGNITIPADAGDVILAALSDDGVRVWVDNQLCIDNWGPNDSVTTESASILKAGQTYQLRVEYMQLGGDDIISLKWRSGNPTRSVWIPPGNWINAWTGATMTGPGTVVDNTTLEQIPLYIRSGSIFPLAPQMQYTGQLPWDPITLDVYPSPTESDQNMLYEDDTLTTAYKQGEYRTTTLKTWADDASKTVSVSIGAAVGNFSGALTQRSWMVRLHRPPNWSQDMAPTEVTLNGQPIHPIVRRVKNVTAMPLGSDNGAPDADVFEITIPESSVLSSNLLVATFTSATSPWACADVGCVGANGNVIEGASTVSNVVWLVRGGGAGIGGTNDGFHFLYQTCVSNAQVTVRLSGQSSVNAGAESGIMFSENLNPSACNAVIAMTADNHLVFQSRSTVGTAGQTTTISGFSAPCWLRLLRHGNNFTAYASTSGALWTQVASATIPGFNSQGYIGLVATAGINSTNSVEDTNYNQAVFNNLTLDNSVSISTVPDQATAKSTPTPAIPFTVNSTDSDPLTVTTQSSNTNVLSVQNIAIGGTGANRFVVLTPNMGATGISTITLTVSDGVNTASTEFNLVVLAATDSSISRVLLNENFDNYPTGNLPGQSFQGTGFAAAGHWTGLDSSFDGSVADAAGVSFPGLTSPLISTSGGAVTIKGDGSNLEGVPDLSANGSFASAGLLDDASETIGGGNVSGALYFRFLIRAHFNTGNGAYGGLHLSRGDDNTGVLIGDSLPAWAYSIWSPSPGTSSDLDNNDGGYLFLDTNVHLIVGRIDYQSGADDAVTVWLDPDTTAGENDQYSLTTYIGVASGDFSFDRFFLRGGPGGKQFDFGNICFGTSWSAVVPTAPTASSPVPTIQSTSILSEGNFNFSFTGSAGGSYSILATTNLALPLADWTAIHTGTFGFDPVVFDYVIPTNESRRFFCISMLKASGN